MHWYNVKRLKDGENKQLRYKGQDRPNSISIARGLKLHGNQLYNKRQTQLFER